MKKKNSELHKLNSKEKTLVSGGGLQDIVLLTKKGRVCNNHECMPISDCTPEDPQPECAPRVSCGPQESGPTGPCQP